MSDTMESQSKAVKRYETIARSLRFGGILGIIFGGIHFLTYSSDTSSKISLYDGIFNFAFGVLFLIIYKVFKERSRYAIHMVVVAAIGSVIYGLLMGRGFNYIIVAFCLYEVFLFWQLRREGILY
jgi:riboflavin transporter FmnP